DDPLEVVDVVEVTAVELPNRGVEVARDAEVDEQEPASLPAPQHIRHRRRAKHEACRVRRGDHDVDTRKFLADAPALGLAVGDQRDLGTAAAEVAGGLLAHLAGAEEEDRPALEAAED